MHCEIKSVSLKNGMNCIIVPRSFVPRVSMQLWYNVGSKNEDDSNRGIAHMIEHMIFKGTEKMQEGTLDKIVYKLCGSCNAFTSYDYTAYTFDMPAENYLQIMPIMADFMENCKFDQNLLNSELKAVFQELKMYNDDSSSTLFKAVLESIFSEHPYRHPIIGYKDTIINFKQKQLQDFYKQNYNTKNATLVIVGDINIDECIENFKASFENIKAPDKVAEKKVYFHEKDTLVSDKKIYRDVTVATNILAWEVPAAKKDEYFAYDVFSNYIGSGRASKLYKKAVYENEYAVDISAFFYDLFDYGLFCVYFQPREIEDISKIKEIVKKEIELIANGEIDLEELFAAIKKTKMGHISIFEDNSKIAYSLGKLYLATEDPEIINNYIIEDKDLLINIFKNLANKFLKDIFMHEGSILPLKDENDIKVWESLQEERDKKDKENLDKIKRESYENIDQKDLNIKINDFEKLKFPNYTKESLDNGVTIYAIDADLIDRVDIFVDFKAKHYFDDPQYSGQLGLLFDLMEEGTKKYTGNTFGEKVEAYGMDFYASPGSIYINCLPEDTEKAVEFLSEYIFNPELEENAWKRVKENHLNEIKNYLDDSNMVAKQTIRELVYGNHPYSYNPSGSINTVNKINLERLKNQYKKYLIPEETIIVVCGAIKNTNIIDNLKKTFGDWKNKEILTSPLIEFPKKPTAKLVNKYMNKDQAVLFYGGLSVERLNKNYDPLIVFDQIFGGGVSGSMNSKLFKLREQTGMFYAIGGSLVGGCAEHNGMFYVKAITSNDLVEKSIELIDELILNVAKDIKEEQITDGKRILENSLVDIFATYKSIASVFIFMHRYNLSPEFFKERGEKIKLIKNDDIEEAVNSILLKENIVKLKVGRFKNE